MTELLIDHMVADRNKEPFVVVKSDAARHQLSPMEARALGLRLVQAAATSEVEAFVHEFALKLGGDANHAAALLLEFRQHEDLDAVAINVMLPSDTGEVEMLPLQEARATGCWFLDVSALAVVEAMLFRYLVEALKQEPPKVNFVLQEFREAYIARRGL